MGTVKSFEDLAVWQRAMELAETVYRYTSVFPREETWGLRQQIRRAVTSIPSNIAEGQGRGTTKEFLHFLRIARGSLNELVTELLLARRFGFIEADRSSSIRSLADEVSRMLGALIRSLESRRPSKSNTHRTEPPNDHQ